MKKEPERAAENAAVEEANRLTDQQMAEVTGGMEADRIRIIIKDKPGFAPPVMRFGFSIDKEA